MSGAVRIAIVLAVAAAATMVANVVLLGLATGRQDPVGRLTPPAAAPRSGRIAVARPSTPAVHAHEREHRDD